MNSGAIGLIETKGLVGAVEASDAMVKTSDVVMISKAYIGSGIVTVICQGEVAAVKAAVEAGTVAAKRVSEVLATHIIPRPHQELDKIISGKYVRSGRGTIPRSRTPKPVGASVKSAPAAAKASAEEKKAEKK
ncbi:MAG: BMC domain-containing protein [Candidatus Humimicrobiaceae bacterium]